MGAEREELWAEMSFTLQFWNNQNSELNGHGECIEPTGTKTKEKFGMECYYSFYIYHGS